MRTTTEVIQTGSERGFVGVAIQVVNCDLHDHVELTAATESLGKCTAGEQTNVFSTTGKLSKVDSKASKS